MERLDPLEKLYVLRSLHCRCHLVYGRVFRDQQEKKARPVNLDLKEFPACLVSKAKQVFNQHLSS